MNLQNLLKNWKTTSAGLTMIIGSVVHLVFSVKNGTDDETTWTISLTAIVGGVGLMFAGDASTTVQAHTETLNELANIKQAVATTAQAVQTGDTSILTKANIPAVAPVVPPSTTTANTIK